MNDAKRSNTCCSFSRDVGFVLLLPLLSWTVSRQSVCEWVSRFRRQFVSLFKTSAIRWWAQSMSLILVWFCAIERRKKNFSSLLGCNTFIIRNTSLPQSVSSVNASESSVYLLSAVTKFLCQKGIRKKLLQESIASNTPVVVCHLQSPLFLSESSSRPDNNIEQKKLTPLQKDHQ